jgi:outer membrane protein OmpA-like peptidoglycan-associated protein
MRPFAKPFALALLTGAAMSAALPAAAQYRVYGRYYGVYPRYYGYRYYGGPTYYPYGVYAVPHVVYPAPYAVYSQPYPVYVPYPVAPTAAPAVEVHPAAVRPASHRNFIVYFPFDRDVLTAEAQSVVHQAVDYERSQPGSRIAVVGHTDAAGSEGYNQDLSRRRSEAVFQALVANGMDARAIQMAWRGEHDQAVLTANGVREQANRRVTIEISGDTTTAAQTRIPNTVHQGTGSY